MSNWEPAGYKDYRWIVADPQLLGGKLAIRGTRLSVSLILECLAGGMSLAEIDESYDHGFPHEALPEVLKVASELTDSSTWLLDATCSSRSFPEFAVVVVDPPQQRWQQYRERFVAAWAACPIQPETRATDSAELAEEAVDNPGIK